LTWHQGLPGKALWVTSYQQRLTVTVEDGPFPGFSEGVRPAIAWTATFLPRAALRLFSVLLFYRQVAFRLPLIHDSLFLENAQACSLGPVALIDAPVQAQKATLIFGRSGLNIHWAVGRS